MHPDSTLHLELKGLNLTNVATGFFSNRTSSPFFRVCSYKGQQNAWKSVATSEPIEFDLNPSWQSVAIRCKELCRCQLDLPIRIEVFDDGQEEAVPMGHLETTVGELLKRHISQYDLTQEGKGTVGKIEVVNAMIEILESSSPSSSERQKKQEQPRIQQSPGRQGISAITATTGQPSLMGGAINEVRRRFSLGNQMGETAGAQAPPTNQNNNENDNNESTRAHSQEVLHLTLRGIDLAEMPVASLGHDNHRVAVSRCVCIGKFQPGVQSISPFRDIITSNVVEHDQNPVWEEMTLSLDELCGGDLDLPILISVHEHNAKERALMGSCQTTVRELLKCTKKTKGTATGVMTLKHRGRSLGRVAVVWAELATPKVEKDSQDDEESEGPVQEPNWLARTLNLAAGLINPTSSLDDRNDDHSTPDDSVDEEKIDMAQETITEPTPVYPVARITQPVSHSESDDGDSDDDDDDDDSTSSESDDEITVAHVLSIAEDSMRRGTTSKQDREGLLELAQLLSPKKKGTKSSAGSILEGMPDWDLDGDSVMDGADNHRQQQQPQQRPGARDADDLSVADLYIINEAEPVQPKAEGSPGIAAFLKRSNESNTTNIRNDDLAKDDDTVLLKRQVALSLEANFKGDKESARKRAKTKVQRTLKSIYGILKKNLESSIPATSVSPSRTLHNAPEGEEQVLEDSSKAMKERDDDMSALDRLVEMGFDREAVISAYAASNKNEMMAANMLMDGVGADGNEARAPPKQSRAEQMPAKEQSSNGGIVLHGDAGADNMSQYQYSVDPSQFHDVDCETVHTIADESLYTSWDPTGDREVQQVRSVSERNNKMAVAGKRNSIPTMVVRHWNVDYKKEITNRVGESEKKRTKTNSLNRATKSRSKSPSIRRPRTNPIEKSGSRSGRKPGPGGHEDELFLRSTATLDRPGPQRSPNQDADANRSKLAPPPKRSGGRTPQRGRSFDDGHPGFEKLGLGLTAQLVQEGAKENSDPKQKERKRRVLPRHMSRSGGLNRMKDKMVKLDDTPVDYLVSQGLPETDAQAVVDAAGIATMGDFAFFDDKVLREVAREAGLKTVPAKKLSNAVRSFCDKNEAASVRSYPEGSTKSKGTKKLSGAAAKVADGLGRGARAASKSASKLTASAARSTVSASKTVARSTVHAGKATVEAVKKGNSKPNRTKALGAKPVCLAGQMDREVSGGHTLPSLNISLG